MTVIGWPATRPARNSASSSLCGAGAEVDVVGVQHHSGELRVGVGVLEGAAAADQHTGAARAAAARPAAATPMASDHDADRSLPSSSRTCGVVIRSPLGGVGERPAALVAVPLLVDLRVVTGQAAQHLSAPVIGALGASRRAVFAHARLETRSNGRARNRYAVPVSAPTGQICTVLPEKYESNGSPGAMPTCCRRPRSSSSMNGSPAIWLENRVHRAHSTQRSRSSSTCADRLDRFGEGAFDVLEAGLGAAVGHRLVLQRAFAALVADRAVQRVVDQQQFHHAVLGLVGGLGGVLGAHHHVGGAP